MINKLTVIGMSSALPTRGWYRILTSPTNEKFLAGKISISIVDDASGAGFLSSIETAPIGTREIHFYSNAAYGPTGRNWMAQTSFSASELFCLFTRVRIVELANSYALDLYFGGYDYSAYSTLRLIVMTPEETSVVEYLTKEGETSASPVSFASGDLVIMELSLKEGFQAAGYEPFTAGQLITMEHTPSAAPGINVTAGAGSAPYQVGSTQRLRAYPIIKHDGITYFAESTEDDGTNYDSGEIVIATGQQGNLEWEWPVNSQATNYLLVRSYKPLGAQSFIDIGFKEMDFGAASLTGDDGNNEGVSPTWTPMSSYPNPDRLGVCYKGVKGVAIRNGKLLVGEVDAEAPYSAQVSGSLNVGSLYINGSPLETSENPVLASSVVLFSNTQLNTLSGSGGSLLSAGYEGTTTVPSSLKKGDVLKLRFTAYTNLETAKTAEFSVLVQGTSRASTGARKLPTGELHIEGDIWITVNEVSGSPLFAISGKVSVFKQDRSTPYVYVMPYTSVSSVLAGRALDISAALNSWTVDLDVSSLTIEFCPLV